MGRIRSEVAAGRRMKGRDGLIGSGGRNAARSSLWRRTGRVALGPALGAALLPLLRGQLLELGGALGALLRTQVGPGASSGSWLRRRAHGGGGGGLRRRHGLGGG